MKRLHHFLIFILSVTILCLSTGMSHIHICSDQCCKAKSCLMHSPIQPDTDSCCKASPSSKTTSQQLSASCTCFQIDYTAEFYFSHTDYVLPAVMPMDLSTPVFTWYFFPVQFFQSHPILSHAPPLNGRNRLIRHSILII